MPGLGKRQRQILLTLLDGQSRKPRDFGEVDPYPLQAIRQAIRSLESMGLVEEDPYPTETGGRTGQYYRLTLEGYKAASYLAWSTR